MQKTKQQSMSVPISVFLAFQFAIEKHGTQMRRTPNAGSAVPMPYIIHPARVATSVLRYFNENRSERFQLTENQLAIVALLHDVLEDTECTPEEIEAAFGPKVLAVVRELTSDENEIARMGKGAYLAQKIGRLSVDAVFVKLLDRLDNIGDYAKAGPADRAAKYAEQTGALVLGLQLEMFDCFRDIVIEILHWTLLCDPASEQLKGLLHFAQTEFDPSDRSGTMAEKFHKQLNA